VTRFKGAIVGFGQVAEYGHWPAFAGSDAFQIVAVVERSAVRRDAAARMSPGIRAVATLDEIADTDIDFVDICTPPALHAAPILAALERGWHVICEKPFLLETADVDAVRRAAVRAGRAVVPVHNWKYAPIIQQATELLTAGAIGRLRRVSIETLRQRDCAVSDPDRPNWRRDATVAGGGIVMDHGWHAVYLALHWFGQPPASVSATVHRPSASDGEAVEDEATMTLNFPAGDAEIVLSWNADVRRNGIVLTGDEGELEIADGILQMRGGAGDKTWAVTPALSAGSYHADWFALMLPEFRRAFADPDASRALFEEAATCLDVIQRAYEAASAANLPRIASSIGLT
jgi:predicted dehydrogenase